MTLTATAAAEAPQAMSQDQLTTFVKDVLKGEGMGEVLDMLKEMQKRGTNYRADVEGGASGKVLPFHRRAAAEEKAGDFAGKAVRALMVSKGDPERALAFAKKEWGEDSDVAKGFAVQKDLAATVNADGGFLLAEDFSRDLIALLRPMTAVGKLNPVYVPLNNVLRMPKQTAGASGSWIGENEVIAIGAPKFGQIVMTPHKYASIVVASNDLLRRGGQDTERMLTGDMTADVATATDLAYIRGTGLQGQPMGLASQIAAGNKFNSNGTTAANVTTDLGTAIQFLGDNNVAMIRPGWIIEWRTWRHLVTLRDGNNNLIFKPEMDGGRLFGFPFAVTSQLPRNLGGGANQTEIYFVDFADVVVGQATNVIVDVSDVAAYESGGTVKAAFSRDQTVLRTIVETDIALRHDVSGVLIQQVAYGT
jgi:HK97 family phage major capsid protein